MHSLVHSSSAQLAAAYSFSVGAAIGTPTMAHRELAGVPLHAQILHHVTAPRRYKTYVIAGFSLLFLAAFWTYGGIGPYDGFRSNHTTDHDLEPTPSQTTPAQESAPSEWKAQNPAGDAGSLIPPKIWQIMLPKKPSDEKKLPDAETLQHIASWVTMNTDYTYTMVGDKGGKGFVHSRFANDPEVVELYDTLPNVGMKSDLLRYLILDVEGGVYTDTDTIALKAIDKWVPKHLRGKVRLIVGVEFDRRDGGAWADIPHWLQFCQWTIAAAPGHPVFRKMVDRVLQSTKDLSAAYQVPVGELHPTSFEVMNSTGPAAFTDVVFEQLQEYEPSLNTTKDLSFMTEPVLYGDILVLTIDGFGMGQSHSHSTHDGSIPDAALMKHLFQGSWRGD